MLAEQRRRTQGNQLHVSKRRGMKGEGEAYAVKNPRLSTKSVEKSVNLLRMDTLSSQRQRTFVTPDQKLPKYFSLNFIEIHEAIAVCARMLRLH